MKISFFNIYFLKGCKERHDEFLDYMPDWTAFRSTDYGYTRMKVINATHLHLEQVSDDKVVKTYIHSSSLIIMLVKLYSATN